MDEKKTVFAGKNLPRRFFHGKNGFSTQWQKLANPVEVIGAV